MSPQFPQYNIKSVGRFLHHALYLYLLPYWLKLTINFSERGFNDCCY